MRYGSVCSGIEAATVAWHPLGWVPVFFAENSEQPSAVLAHRYPNVPNLGDFTKIGIEHGPIDLLVGGTPCQSFSVAGLRGGMADARGNLALEYLRLAQRLRPQWLVWENVPGVLSSNGGRDFGAILGGMVELGYGVAYRVLDAQHFGVPQRRRRVFVVGHLGDWRRAAAVLFERHGLSGDSAPRREARESVASTISARPTGGGGLGTDFDCDGGLVANPVGTRWHSAPEDQRDNDVVTHSLRADGFDASEDGTGRGVPITADTVRSHPRAGSNSVGLLAFGSKASGRNGFAAGDVSPTLRSMSHSKSHQNGGGQVAIAIQERAVCENPDAGPDGVGIRDDGLAYTLEARTVPRAVASFDPRNVTSRANRTKVEYGAPANTLHEQGQAIIGSAVRRLTPRECERLQGFPDDYTLVPYKGRLMADGPRYKMLGNSFPVNVVRWIGRRIEMVEAIP